MRTGESDAMMLTKRRRRTADCVSGHHHQRLSCSMYSALEVLRLISIARKWRTGNARSDAALIFNRGGILTLKNTVSGCIDQRPWPCQSGG